VFYLGRRFDAHTKKTTDDLVLYDSKDLVTHALCVGMTGSSETGLGVAVIEEAAIDGVPVIVIDPKGDLTNLLLTFPDLRGEDFAPWVGEDVRGGRGRRGSSLPSIGWSGGSRGSPNGWLQALRFWRNQQSAITTQQSPISKPPSVKGRSAV
jgi:DNA helicase HerA-like ATPase